jgi:hypothetical protein
MNPTSAFSLPTSREVKRLDPQDSIDYGANKGIRFQVARQLGKEGTIVFVAARNPKLGGDATLHIGQEGAEVAAFYLARFRERNSARYRGGTCVTGETKFAWPLPFSSSSQRERPDL